MPSAINVAELGGKILPYNGLDTLKNIFEDTARRVPHNVAIESSSGDYSLSYQELDNLSDRLAQVLRNEFHVGLNTRVGLTAERTVEALISMLAVLKAGGAYVPLGLRHPDARLRFIGQDIEPSVVLCGTDCAERFEKLGITPLHVVSKSSLETLPTSTPKDDVIGPSAHDLAYIIYTSGTTGQPKGVMVDHLAVARYIDAMQQLLSPGNERVIQIMELTFDSSIFDVWMAWAFGGTAVVCQEWTCLEVLGDFIQSRDITYLGCTPTQLSVLEPDQVPNLQVVAIGGEAVPPALIEKWSQHSSCRIYNQYGPTEATVTVTSIQCSPNMKSPKSIGFANPASVKLYIVDENDGNKLVPPGIPGELCIAGPQVARGYYNRAKLTAKTFVQNPFSSSPEIAVLYKTGDQCRWLDDGTVEYLGRIDSQVKLRGFRIELGEIENKLLELDSISACSVALKHRNDGTAFLCAYLVGIEVDVASLRSHLALSLPDHMIPAAYCVVASIPVDSSGKTDRKALPDPDPRHFVVSAHSRQSPSTVQQSPLFVQISNIFASVLGLDATEINLDSNFFQLGGQSLSAARLLGQLRQEFGIRIKFADFFVEPTLDNVVRRIQASSCKVSSIIRPRRTSQPVLPLASAQSRMYYLYQLDPESPVYNVSAVFDIRNGAIDHGHFERAFQTVIGRHEILRSSYRHCSDGLFQVVKDNAVFSLRKEDLCRMSPDRKRQDAATMIPNFVSAPFHLDCPDELPIRAMLVQLEGEYSQLVIAAHHIAMDGLSWDIFYAELSAAYSGRPLRPLPFQFGDYSLWEAAFRQSTEYREQLSFWRDLLGENPATLNLPADRPCPSIRSGKGATVTRSFDGLAGHLREAATVHSATPFCVLLSLYFSFLHRLTGQNEIIVGILSSGRSQPDTDALIGMFVNTLPVKVDLGDNVGVSELITRVKRTTSLAFDNQDAAFDDIVSQLVHSRRGGQTPLVQTMLTMDSYDENDASGLALDGLDVSEVDSGEVSTAMFDFSIGCNLGPGDCLAVEAEYATDLFDRSTAVRMVDKFEEILRETVLVEGRSDDQARRLNPQHKSVPNPLLTLSVPTKKPSETQGDTFMEPQTTEEMRLASIFCEVLDLPHVDIRDSFFVLGGDSLLSLRLVALARSIGYFLNVSHVIEFQTVEKLASFLLTAAALEPRNKVPDPKVESGLVCLTPMQRWFFNEKFPEPSHYNQSRLFALRHDVDDSILKETLAAIIRHHDALRLSFEIDGCNTRQYQNPIESASQFLSFRIVNESKESFEGLPVAIENETARDQKSLDVVKGPLVCATLFMPPSSGPTLLFVAIHHLVVDEYSWDVLVEDLNLAYFQLSHGRPVSLPLKSHSFAQWTSALHDYSLKCSLTNEVAHWHHAESSSFTLPIIQSRMDGYNPTTFAEEEISTIVTIDKADALASSIAIRDLLVAALAYSLVAFSQETGDVCILIEGHGREDLVAPGFDFFRTVGWFTTIFPVRFEFGEVSDATAALRIALDCLGDVPNNGVGYGLLKYPYSGQSPLSDDHASQVTFNYLGRSVSPDTHTKVTDSTKATNLIRSEQDGFSCASDWDPRNQSADSILDISCHLVDDRFELAWRFRSDLLTIHSIQQLADQFSTNLAAMASITSKCPLERALLPGFRSTLEKDIGILWEKHCHHGRFNGLAFSVVFDGKVVLTGGHGFRDAARDTPIDDRTVFSLGSAGKPMVSLLAAVLADEGLVNLDEPLASLISRSKLALPDVYGRMTLRHLLSMTAGIPDVDYRLEERIDDPFELCRSEIEIVHEPGTRYYYSNFSYALAGYFLTLSVGLTADFAKLPDLFLQLLQEKVFDPVGMQDAQPESFQVLRKNNAVLKSDHVKDAVGSAAMLPSGPVKASVTDTAHFLITEYQRGLAPNNCRVASSRHVQERFDVSNSLGYDWGMGWFRDRTHDFLHISGQWADAECGLKVDPATGFGFSYIASVRDSTHNKFLEMDMDCLFITQLKQLRKQRDIR